MPRSFRVDAHGGHAAVRPLIARRSVPSMTPAGGPVLGYAPRVPRYLRPKDLGAGTWTHRANVTKGPYPCCHAPRQGHPLERSTFPREGDSRDGPFEPCPCPGTAAQHNWREIRGNDERRASRTSGGGNRVIRSRLGWDRSRLGGGFRTHRHLRCRRVGACSPRGGVGLREKIGRGAIVAARIAPLPSRKRLVSRRARMGIRLRPIEEERWHRSPLRRAVRRAGSTPAASRPRPPCRGSDRSDRPASLPRRGKAQ
jgi:hypothetical protein